MWFTSVLKSLDQGVPFAILMLMIAVGIMIWQMKRIFKALEDNGKANSLQFKTIEKSIKDSKTSLQNDFEKDINALKADCEKDYDAIKETIKNIEDKVIWKDTFEQAEKRIEGMEKDIDKLQNNK